MNSEAGPQCDTSSFLFQKGTTALQSQESFPSLSGNEKANLEIVPSLFHATATERRGLPSLLPALCTFRNLELRGIILIGCIIHGVQPSLSCPDLVNVQPSFHPRDTFLFFVSFFSLCIRLGAFPPPINSSPQWETSIGNHQEAFPGLFFPFSGKSDLPAWFVNMPGPFQSLPSIFPGQHSSCISVEPVTLQHYINKCILRFKKARYCRE